MTDVDRDCCAYEPLGGTVLLAAVTQTAPIALGPAELPLASLLATSHHDLAAA